MEGEKMDNEEIAREHQLIFDLAKSNKRRIDNLEEEQKELRSLTQAVSMAEKVLNLITAAVVAFMLAKIGL